MNFHFDITATDQHKCFYYISNSISDSAYGIINI